MRLVDKESEWHDTQAAQKQSKNKESIVKAMNCKFNHLSVIDFTV